MRFKKPTLLVDEADLETIDYKDEPNEDIFANESILAAALGRYNKLKAENNLDQAETINVDNLNLDDVKENKNAIIASKKITDKYKKLSRKRRRRQGPPTVAFKPSKKRSKSTKSALIAARNRSKKYKNLRFL